MYHGTHHKCKRRADYALFPKQLARVPCNIYSYFCRVRAHCNTILMYPPDYDHVTPTCCRAGAQSATTARMATSEAFIARSKDHSADTASPVPAFELLKRCRVTAPAAGSSASDAAIAMAPPAKKRLRCPCPCRWSEITPMIGCDSPQAKRKRETRTEMTHDGRGYHIFYQAS